MPKKGLFKFLQDICPVCLGGKMLLRYSRNTKAPVLSQVVIMKCPRCKGKGSI
jgi:hypothetical protein